MMRPALRLPSRLRRPAVLAVLTLVAGVVPVVSPGPAWAATAFTSTVVNQANANCTAVPNGAGTNALQLVQSSCNSAANQSFKFTPLAGSADTYTVGTVTSGSCVDIS